MSPLIMLTGGEALEEYALRRAGDGMRDLIRSMRTQGKRARLVDGALAAVPALRKGDVVRMSEGGAVPADVVTTTTHKSLRGPRGALIFFRRGERQVGKKTVPYDLEEKINFSVFPGLQGGPHNHTISALATALKQAAEPEFVEYQRQVIANSARFAEALMGRGYDLVSGGTDNHLVLVDLRSKGIDGARVERVMELARMASNKNTVPGDKSALVPSGIRMGTPALTSRGFEEADFEQVAEFFDRAVQLSSQIKSEMPTKKLKDFLAALPDENANADVLALRNDVKAFALGFPTVGF